MVTVTVKLMAALAIYVTTTLSLNTDIPDAILSTYRGLVDLSHSNLRPALQLKLDRRELAPLHIQARSVRKPYTVGETFPSAPPSPMSSSTPPLSSGLLSAAPDEIELLVPMTSISKEYGYTATVSIGTYDTPDQQHLFNLLVDTGSDLAAVTSASCTDPECLQVRHRYDPSISWTAAPTKNYLTDSPRWAQIYGDGTVANGTLVQDTLRFISSSSSSSSSDTSLSSTSPCLEVLDQPILAIDQPGLHLVKSYGYGVDGILGMNLRSTVVSQTLIQNLQRQEAQETGGQIGFMGLWLGKSLEAGQGGELLLNGIDTTRFEGPLRWMDRGPSPFDWSIPLDRGILLVDPSSSAEADAFGPAARTWSASSSSFPLSFSTAAKSTTTTADTTTTMPFTLPMTEYSFAVLDSGSDGIYFQRPTYDALFQQIPQAKQLKTGYWRVPCEGGNLELWIGIQGEIYKIPYEDWVKKPTAAGSHPEVVAEVGPGMCQTKVFGSSPGPTLLGATFLRSIYTVFDFRRPGYERVGLARLATPPPPPPPSAY
ncbi:hypothetical protein BGX23_009580 [Mortierella sp. AD031]|nr:hypothetical protein BGX23_009580 [Mortierella sp. AD031]